MVNVRVRMGKGKNTSMDGDDVAALASFQIWTQLPYPGSPGPSGNQAACGCFPAAGELN